MTQATTERAAITWHREASVGPVAMYVSDPLPSGNRYAIMPEANRTWTLCNWWHEGWIADSTTAFLPTVALAKAEAERQEAAA